MFSEAWEPASLVLSMAAGMKLFSNLRLWPSEVSSLFSIAQAKGFKSLDIKLEMTAAATGSI